MTRNAVIIGQVLITLALGACSGETTPTSVPLPPPYGGPFELAPVPDPASPRDVQSPLTLASAGFIPVAFVPNTSSAQLVDLDVFELGDRVYVAQRRNPSGYLLMDVTVPAHPIYLGAWEVNPPSTGEHIRAFRQSDRWYLALPLEVDPRVSLACGLAIIEITDPEVPMLRGVHNGATSVADANWCDVHSVGVVTDEEGNAEYLLATSPDTFDLRVLDIRDLNRIWETNVYHLHVHPHGGRAWAHAMTVAGNRVYVSHWDGGVMILDKTALLSGADSEDVELTSSGGITAPDFGAHDASPTADGEFLFVNDAFLSDGGLRVFDIRDLARPQPVMTVDLEGLQSQRHTLQVQDDLLLVPWREMGVRVYRYDFSQTDNPVLELVAFQEVREQPRDHGHGVAAVQSHPCLIEGTMHTCVYATVFPQGLIILALDDT